jgi:hypothetical protein
LFAAVCAAGSVAVAALCCERTSAAPALRTPHANTPHANVNALAKKRRFARLTAKIFLRAIKKPRE